jgi:hypothetical protein
MSATTGCDDATWQRAIPLAAPNLSPPAADAIVDPMRVGTESRWEVSQVRFREQD